MGVSKNFSYKADPARYDGRMPYNRCGKSGLKLPAISLGLWHNFGSYTPHETAQQMLLTAFDAGITHFDIANNYGPPPGAAEETFGYILKTQMKAHRDEMIISSKAGFPMWEGPYGDGGSRKYLLSSLDQSLKRTGLEYFDIFYHHVPDSQTPIEESMAALASAVHQGKALYAGISNYGPEQTKIAAEILAQMRVPLLIHQVNYSMMRPEAESQLLPVLHDAGAGMIAFCPLAGGRLTNRYFEGVPEDSRAKSPSVFLQERDVGKDMVDRARKLNDIAMARGQSLAQMALSWVLRGGAVSALIGASKPEQILENVKAVQNCTFTDEQLQAINQILS